jgi:hypothetical protein
MKPEEFSEGAYELASDVTNPLGDRRVTREFCRLPVWKEGTRVFLRFDPDPDFAGQPVIFTRYTFEGVRPGREGSDGRKRWDALTRALRGPLPADVTSLCAIAGWENWDSPLLHRLVADGKITLADVQNAINAEREA